MGRAPEYQDLAPALWTERMDRPPAFDGIGEGAERTSHECVDDHVSARGMAHAPANVRKDFSRQ